MTMQTYETIKSLLGKARTSNRTGIDSLAAIMGPLFLGPFFAGSFLMWAMNYDPDALSHGGANTYGVRDYWALLSPVVLVCLVLAVALVPFASDLAALRRIARRSSTFAFAWTAMVLAAAIYAHLYEPTRTPGLQLPKVAAIGFYPWLVSWSCCISFSKW
jgi:UDP-N-acetylmuramyl pentapeptide phosphotransferase/UDP-N-acetylglucosamine-1-phosphate transferase